MEKHRHYDLFISYSRKDFEEVRRFVDLLQSSIPELTCWFDITGIESGDEFEEKIIAAINNSSYVLFALSDNSIQSRWTKDEVMYAKNIGKKVIPILLNGAKLNEGWFLFKFGRIDCIDSTIPVQVEKLLRDLSTWTGKTCSDRMIPETSVSNPDQQVKPLKGFSVKWLNSNKKGCLLSISILMVMLIAGIPITINLLLHDDVCLSSSAQGVANMEPIDLMLPSGTLWANMNVGAKSVYDTGNYYSWGETEPKQDYSKVTYDYIGNTKYKNIAGQPEFDAAMSNDIEWQLPTVDQYEELIRECEWTWEIVMGCAGYFITGSNGNSIFLPASGWINKSGIEYQSQYGYYWTGERFNDEFAKQLIFSASERNVGNGYLHYGRSIRPVFRTKNK